VFLSEGAGMDVIIKEIEKNGETVLRDAFGHVRLDDLNPGEWFAKQLGKRLNANKVLVQKSGYFSRSSKANQADLDLIFELVNHAVQSALNGISGVVGWDEENDNILSCIDFSRIKGGKPFDTTLDWYKDMIDEIKTI
jgi:pyrophosphate--fructose-6-phosphate 1-phosphotransferase